MVLVQQKQKTNMAKRKLLLSLVIVAAVLTGVIWKLNHHPLASTAKTTSKAPTAQNNYSAGTPRPSSASTGNSQGGVVDTKGRDVNASDSQPAPPSSAAITLTSPTTGATVMPGDTVSGKASVSAVMFRLIDNDAGVIAQGQMTVVDGKFSGTLRFQPKSSTGQLDIYSTNSLGAEENEIQIPVQFNK
jgi:cytoskeletal protein RodZ